MTTFELDTKREELADITARVRGAVQASGILEGLCCVYCPHTTAGLTINENADPDVKRDMLLALGDIFADRPGFAHVEGNSAAHLRASAMGAGLTIPVHRGQLVLGRWQGVYFCEFDGPRHRRFMVQVLGE